VPEAKLFLLLSALVWLMHRANITRLISGTETQIGGG
jgi:glycerol-3-phosphate acyltransferase PlsY